jgi:hypothetical protein
VYDISAAMKSGTCKIAGMYFTSANLSPAKRPSCFLSLQVFLRKSAESQLAEKGPGNRAEKAGGGDVNKLSEAPV